MGRRQERGGGGGGGRKEEEGHKLSRAIVECGHDVHTAHSVHEPDHIP